MSSGGPIGGRLSAQLNQDDKARRAMHHLVCAERPRMRSKLRNKSCVTVGVNRCDARPSSSSASFLLSVERASSPTLARSFRSLSVSLAMSRPGARPSRAHLPGSGIDP